MTETIQLLTIISSFVIFMIAHFISKYRDRVAANREVYQRLEFASIELFRFEADHPELVKSLWQEGELAPKKDSVEEVLLQDFVCQYLNLFEMAYRFRKEDIVPHDVFGSWVVWYFNLAGAAAFPRVWAQLRCDYTEELVNIMDKAVAIHSKVIGETAQRKTFFTYFANLLDNCPHIIKWHGNQVVEKASNETLALATLPIETHWNYSTLLVDELVPFMKANMDASYISHSEIMEGRATDAKHWSPVLDQVLRAEFEIDCANNTHFMCSIRAASDKSLVAIGLCEINREASPPYAMLHDVVIDQLCRGQGLGSKLLASIESTLLEQGINRVYIESGLNNEKAHNFFRKAQFIAISTVSYKNLK